MKSGKFFIMSNLTLMTWTHFSFTENSIFFPDYDSHITEIYPHKVYQGTHQTVHSGSHGGMK